MQEAIAWLFPGQGSQAVGMGRDLAGTYPEASAVFDEADAILGFAFSELCFYGPKETLDDTINAQPALLAASIAALRALEARGRLAPPEFVAGHSMGEYSALVAAGSLTFADGLRLVRERGRLMKMAGERAPGGMAAVIGADDRLVEEACQAVDGVQVANYNAPGQVVISGSRAGVEAASAWLKEHGVKRIIPLAVSIAAHSALMQPAVAEFAAAIAATPMVEPRVPLVANLTARPITAVAEIRRELEGQLMGSVRWSASIEYMVAHGVTRFIEIGTGTVLAGLVKRINKDVEAISVGDASSVQSLVVSRGST